MSSLGLEEVFIFRRDTTLFEWDLKDEGGQPAAGLDGWTAKFSGKANLDDADADAVFDLDVELSAPDSKAMLELPADAVAAGRYVAELRLLKDSVPPASELDDEEEPDEPAKEETVHQFMLVVRKDVL